MQLTNAIKNNKKLSCKDFDRRRKPKKWLFTERNWEPA